MKNGQALSKREYKEFASWMKNELAIFCADSIYNISYDEHGVYVDTYHANQRVAFFMDGVAEMRIHGKWALVGRMNIGYIKLRKRFFNALIRVLP